MIEQLLTLTLFGVFCYLLGGIFGRKLSAIVIPLLKQRKSFLIRYIFSIKYWDYILFVLVSIFVVLFIYFFFGYFKPQNIFGTADFIQILIFLATFATLLYTTVINDKPKKEREKPVIAIEFNFFEPDCHKTTTGIGDVYYIRMRVKNDGKSTLEGAEVILEKVESMTNFLPLNLVWALTESQSNRGSVHIPQGSFRTVDIFSIYDLSQLAVFIQQNASSMPQSQLQRFQAMIGSICIAGVSNPNTLTDILPIGEYFFYLSITSFNTAPYYVKLKVKYNGGWDADANRMFGSSNYLDVTLEKESDIKSEVFN